MSRRPPHFIASAKPVNRRTCPPSAVPVDVNRLAGSPIARGRAAAARSRLELGRPLGQQLQPAAHRRHPGDRPIAAALLVSAAVAVPAVMGMPLTGWLAAIIVLALVIAGLRRGRDPGERAHAAPTAWLDNAVLHAFDQLLAAVAPDIEPKHRQRLCEIKTAVVAIARGSTVSAGQLVADDRLYVIECLRRYLPDSLVAYLAVPTTQRCDPKSQTARSAGELLDEQLRLLLDQLRGLEAKVAEGATESLLRQHRFLAGKRRSA